MHPGAPGCAGSRGKRHPARFGVAGCLHFSVLFLVVLIFHGLHEQNDRSEKDFVRLMSPLSLWRMARRVRFNSMQMQQT
jgi:hypothetical protein